MNQLLVKRLTEFAQLPVRGSASAAGYDLFSAYDYTIGANQRGLVKTDISIALSDNTYGRIAPRSGLAWKKGIDVGAGVIDSDYHGNIGVILFNHSNETFEIKKGDRIAQLIIELITTPMIIELPKDQDLPKTVRGDSGFGSTGISNKISNSTTTTTTTNTTNTSGTGVGTTSE